MNVLSIGGSDPSSGAGIQSDLKTFMSLGVYGLTIITAITSQNTRNYSKTEPVSPKIVKSQIESILTDFDVDAIKIGMVYNKSIIKTIYFALKNLKIPVILDPVIRSTTNGVLLEKSALVSYKKLLVPLAYVITPNVFEAQVLSGVKISSKRNLRDAAQKMHKIGAKNVVITGNEFEKGSIFDFILQDGKSSIISTKKLLTVNHGSGCNYSASLTTFIAKGKSISDAVKLAKNYVFGTIQNSQKIGHGIPITIQTKSELEKDLARSITSFQNLSNSFKLIPECQTNFVFSKKNAKTTNDVLGVSGRIVKAGNKTLLAGSLEFGGSRHVASAVVTITKKFPHIRSAINIKYEKNLIKKFKKKRFLVLSYDRTKEPPSIKNKENSSVLWGIGQSIKDTNREPDIIFHKGDLGKEPMILVFGKNPSEVLEKVSSVL